MGWGTVEVSGQWVLRVWDLRFAHALRHVLRQQFELIPVGARQTHKLIEFERPATPRHHRSHIPSEHSEAKQAADAVEKRAGGRGWYQMRCTSPPLLMSDLVAALLMVTARNVQGLRNVRSACVALRLVRVAMTSAFDSVRWQYSR
jgi:hypothetical protein